MIFVLIGDRQQSSYQIPAHGTKQRWRTNQALGLCQTVNINKSKGSKMSKKMSERKLLDMQLHEIIQVSKDSGI